MVSPKTAFRTKIASATILAGASIGALFLRFGRPREEPIVHSERPPQPVIIENEDDDCGPRKSDLRCEVGKGEADPLSKTFDPDSCGFCGDEIRQVNAALGTMPVLDLDSGIQTQQVTERPSETPETCPVDFHCGNGRRDFRKTYGSWLELSDDSGPTGRFFVGTKTLTETIRSCPVDLAGNGHGGGDAGPAEEEESEPLPARPTSAVWNCPSLMMPSSPSDMVNIHSSSMWMALSRIHGAINDNAAALRSALNVNGTARVDVRLNVRVDSEGFLTLREVSAVCDNAACGDAHTIINATRLNLGGLMVGGPGVECFWTLSIRVPTQ